MSKDQCKTCGGSGMINCHRCEGSGWLLNANREKYVCWACKGNTPYPCPNCPPEPCKTCESFTTGECVSDVPCEMDYSAFKPIQPEPAGEFVKHWLDRQCDAQGNIPIKSCFVFISAAKTIFTLRTRIESLEKALKDILPWNNTRTKIEAIIKRALKGE